MTALRSCYERDKRRGPYPRLWIPLRSLVVTLDSVTLGLHIVAGFLARRIRGDSVDDALEYAAAAASLKRTVGGDVAVDYRGVFLAGEYVRGEYDPEPLIDGSTGAPTQTAEGFSVEGGYKLWGGLVDLIGRLDSFDPPAAERRDFLVLGANVYPGLDARLGLQYASRLDDATTLPSDGVTSPVPSPLPGGLADGQFILRLQTGF